ncbi:MAG: APC family permease, partial [Fretibacterium sp.]|nr:APC family permease [Fretibacterium sp.]
MENSYGAGSENDAMTRHVSPLGAWALAFGCTVGWGAFIMPGTTFLPTAGPLGTIIGMSAGMALMLLIAFNYHYMMNRCGGSGGAFTYTLKTLGHDHGFLCGWFLILTYIAILWANATALVLIARNLADGPLRGLLQAGFHYRVAGYDIYLGEAAVSTGAIVLFGLVCARNKTIAGAIQTMMAVLLFAGIVLCLGAAIFRTGGQEFNQPGFPPGPSPSVQILQIAALVPWAFVGFESVSHSTGEFRFSVRRSFTVMALAIVAGGLAYILLTCLAASMQPEGYGSWVDYIGNLRRMDGLKALPVFFVTSETMGRAGLALLAVTLLAAVVTGIVGNYISASRLIYAMAGEGILPRGLHVLGRRNTPERAILFIMAVSVFIPFLGRTAVGWIVDVTSVGATVAYGYTSAAVFRLAGAEGNRRAQALGALGGFVSMGFFLLAIV